MSWVGRGQAQVDECLSSDPVDNANFARAQTSQRFFWLSRIHALPIFHLVLRLFSRPKLTCSSVGLDLDSIIGSSSISRPAHIQLTFFTTLRISSPPSFIMTSQDSTSPVTLRTRKFITNRLLQRKQMVLDVIHPARPNVSKAELSEKLSEMYKTPKEQCVVFGMRTAFGGGRSTGFALIYDSRESMKFEPKHRLVRVSISQRKRISGSHLETLSSAKMSDAVESHATDPVQSSRNSHSDIRISLILFAFITHRLDLPRRLRRLRASSARNARTVPRRSVVPRRPRLPRLPRRSKLVSSCTSPIFPSTHAFRLWPAVVTSHHGTGFELLHSYVAWPTSFRPFFRSRLLHSVDTSVTTFDTSISYQKCTLHRHVPPHVITLQLYHQHVSFLFFINPQKRILTHTHTPEISKEGGVAYQTCYAVPIWCGQYVCPL